MFHIPSILQASGINKEMNDNVNFSKNFLQGRAEKCGSILRERVHLQQNMTN